MNLYKLNLQSCLSAFLWAVFALLSCALPLFADEPTLVRYTILVPEEAVSDMEAIYAAEMLPILEDLGLVQASETAPSVSSGTISRLFVLPPSVQVDSMRRQVTGNRRMRRIGARMNRRYGPQSASASFHLYRKPAGLGRIVPTGPGKAHWRTYDRTDGMASGAVQAILQDRNGYLWFGGNNGEGVSRFDGQTWKTYTPADGLVGENTLSILEARDDVLWFGTRAGGVSRFDGKTWITYTREDGLAGNMVRCMLEDRDGHLWFAGPRGVSRFDGQTWETYTEDSGLADNSVLGMIQDRAGVFWFASRRGVSRFDGNKWQTFRIRQGLAGNRVLATLEDRDGDLWFGTRGGLSRYDGQSWTNWPMLRGEADTRMQAIFQD